MAKKIIKKNNQNSKEIEEGKVFAFLGIFLTVIGFIIASMCIAGSNKYLIPSPNDGWKKNISTPIPSKAGNENFIVTFLVVK